MGHFFAVIVLVVALLVIWKPFGGRAPLLIGLIGAGVAFAAQELIGAVAGWFNILSGSIYRIGDRIEIGGLQGDVIDITPLRTKLMEIGNERGEIGAAASADGSSGPSWVKGRQYTGRLVTISDPAGGGRACLDRRGCARGDARDGAALSGAAD